MRGSLEFTCFQHLFGTQASHCSTHLPSQQRLLQLSRLGSAYEPSDSCQDSNPAMAGGPPSSVRRLASRLGRVACSQSSRLSALLKAAWAGVPNAMWLWWSKPTGSHVEIKEPPILVYFSGDWDVLGVRFGF